MNQETIAVIGAGAGGLPAATALSEQGYRVKIIERGGYLHPNEIKTDRYDYELTAKPWLTNDSKWRGPFELQQGSGVGGSTLYYQAVSTMPPDSVISEWGLPLAEINQLVKEVSQFVKIAGRDQPAHALNPVSRHLYQSAKNLNWKVSPSPVAILSEPHNGRPACNYCGQCVYGCKPGDKSSVDKTWLPRALKTGNVEILTDTTVDSIHLSDKSTVDALLISHNNTIKKMPVSAVILSAGVFESPYLLKRSVQKLAPEGVGNINVGRNLIGTLWQSLLLTFRENFSNAYAGIPIDLLVEEFEAQGILLSQGRNLAGITGPVSVANLMQNHFDVTDIRAWMRTNYGKLAGIGGYAETTTRFKDGIVSLKNKTFNKVIDSEDKKKISEIRKALLQWSDAARAQIVLPLGETEYPIVGAMLRGTCALGNNPDHSAVNTQGQLWGYKNIFVSDASIIGPGLIANPSLLLQVLGLYIGRKCATLMRNVS